MEKILPTPREDQDEGNNPPQGPLEKTRQKLEAFSPTFCTEKWLHVSLHLESGLGHSCCHSSMQQIPVENLSQNPKGLHNTPDKIQDRKMMIEGKRPSSCQYCWRQEEKNLISDRVFKSARWVDVELKPIVQQDDQDVIPHYVEVSFSNKCNLKCSYCSQLFSSSWAQENQKYGPMPLREEPYTKTNEEESGPYFQAFWSWWPQLRTGLQYLRLTGGEPLLSSNFWKLLEELSQNPQSHLNLIINSNLMTATSLIEQLSQKLSHLYAENKIRSIKVVTSLEGHGPQAEYSRFGLHVDRFWKHVDLLLQECPQLTISVTNTIQILAVSTYTQFLEQVLLRRSTLKSHRLTIDPVVLSNPTFLSIENLSHELRRRFESELSSFYETYQSSWSPYEKRKLQNLISLLQRPLEKPISPERLQQTRTYFQEYDRRRSLDFRRVFPELTDFC